MLPVLDEIIKKRKMLDLTQKQLAKLAGVSQSLVAKLEAGEIDPSYTRVKKIFDVLRNLERKNETHASQIFNSEVIGVKKACPVSEAIRLMIDHGYSQLPVFDGNHAVGSISEKTILGQILAGKDINDISMLQSEEIMDETFPQIGKDAPLSLVSSLLQVYPAVLVAHKANIVGIITKADLLKPFSLQTS